MVMTDVAGGNSGALTCPSCTGAGGSTGGGALAGRGGKSVRETGGGIWAPTRDRPEDTAVAPLLPPSAATAGAVPWPAYGARGNSL